MTDLNRNPYTIQMIQNAVTLGKEEGCRETFPSDSFSADIFYWKDPVHKLTMPSAERWHVFQVYHECPLGVWRSEERSKTSHLSLSPSLWRESLFYIMMSCYVLWIKRGFLKVRWGLEVFFLISHTPWGLKENSAANSLELCISDQAVGLLVCYFQAECFSPFVVLFVLRYEQQLMCPRIVIWQWKITVF